MALQVLVVDDDELILEVVRTVLDLEDLDVRTARDGDQALASIAAERPDIIVTDLMMPGIDGIELCRRIKADGATAAVPVILLTARDRPEDREAGLAAGADAYLTKPFSPLELIEVIGGLTEERTS